jgi:hypothetical protein
MPTNETINASKRIDYVLVIFMLFNAIGTAAMYGMVLLLGRHSATFDVVRTQAYAVADLPFTVLPQLVAAYAIIFRKRWAPILVLLVAAAYLHGITVMMVEDVLSNRIGTMFSMDFYFLAFAVAAIIWAVRRLNIGAQEYEQ